MAYPPSMRHINTRAVFSEWLFFENSPLSTPLAARETIDRCYSPMTARTASCISSLPLPLSTAVLTIGHPPDWRTCLNIFPQSLPDKSGILLKGEDGHLFDDELF